MASTLNLMQGDCLEVMKSIPDGSIDMILCDLPYGTTHCKWDTVIPFEPLWKQYSRTIKRNGAIILFSTHPFTATLVLSNPKLFRYELIWQKEQATNFIFIRKQFGKIHENICVFYQHQPTYFPLMEKSNIPVKTGALNPAKTMNNQILGAKPRRIGAMDRFPCSILKFTRERKPVHPTQKPVALLEYLIRTYTNEGETVLDNCMGSGSTGVACINTERNFIGIELDEKFFGIATKRTNDARTDPP